MTTHSNPLLTERATTHGDIISNAVAYEEMTAAFWNNASQALGENTLLAYPLDMIFMKLTRIATGDPTYEDHWKDLVGYAELGMKLAQTKQ